jgi:hypothetical protein
VTNLLGAFCRWLKNHNYFTEFIEQSSQVAGRLEADLFTGQFISAYINDLVVE